MSMKFRRVVPAVVCGIVGIGASGVFAAEPTTTELLQQIEQLRNKVEQLETKQVNQSDVDATVQQVLADAERRSQLLQSEGFTAGYSKGKFLIQSADGSFSMNPNAQLQIRHVSNFADDSDGGEEIVEGFEMRRVKFGFAGNVFTKALKYNFTWATNRAGSGTTDAGGVFLEDAVVEYAINEQFTIKAGQYKVPVHHEELTSSKRQMAVDRSIVNEELGGGYTDRSQGVSLIYTPSKQLSMELMYHDGANQDNTNFADDAPNYGVAGRVEYVVFGDPKSYADFSAMGNKEDLLVFGGGADYSPTGDSYVLAYTFDGQFETTNGTSVYVAYLGLQSDEGGAGSTHDWGGLVQVAQMVSSKAEVFGRYGYIDLDESDDSVHEITVGVNYYFYGHNVKGTLDLVYLPEGTDSDSGLGYVGSDDSQVVLRAQFQLLI